MKELLIYGALVAAVITGAAPLVTSISNQVDINEAGSAAQVVNNQVLGLAQTLTDI